MKLITLFLAKNTKNYEKRMLNSGKTFKIKVSSCWTVFKISLCQQLFEFKVLHGKEIAQYLQNYKCHEVEQGYSEKFLESSTREETPCLICCIIFEEIYFSISIFNCFLAQFFYMTKKSRQKFEYLDNEKMKQK